MTKILSLLLSLVFSFSSFAQGDSYFSTSRKVDSGLLNGSVYTSGNYPGAILMKVNILGEVQKPGVHHMPSDTDLNTALGFAGGPTRYANIKNAVIKRDENGSEVSIDLDLNKHFRQIHQEKIHLKSNDTLYIPQNNAVISDNTFRVIVTLSFIVGTVLSAVSIHQMTKGRGY